MYSPFCHLSKFELVDIIEAANIIGAKGLLQPIFISRHGPTTQKAGRGARFSAVDRAAAI